MEFTDVSVCEFDSDDVGVLGELEDVVCVEVETTDDGGEVVYKEGCGRGRGDLRSWISVCMV